MQMCDAVLCFVFFFITSCLIIYLVICDQWPFVTFCSSKSNTAALKFLLSYNRENVLKVLKVKVGKIVLWLLLLYIIIYNFIIMQQIIIFLWIDPLIIFSINGLIVWFVKLIKKCCHNYPERRSDTFTMFFFSNQYSPYLKYIKMTKMIESKSSKSSYLWSWKHSMFLHEKWLIVLALLALTNTHLYCKNLNL